MERIKVRLSKREPKGSDKVLERTELVRRNVHRRYVPWLIGLLSFLSLLFVIINIAVLTYLDNPDSLVIAVGAEAIVIATVMGVWTSLFNADVVSLTSADMTITIGEKIDDLIRETRKESSEIIVEQRKFTNAVVGIIKERSAEEMDVLRRISLVLETLNEQLGKQAEAISKLEETEREKLEAMQEAEQEKIDASLRRIDIEVKKARPVLQVNLRARGVLTQDMLMSITSRSNDVHNVEVGVVARPPGRKPIRWVKRARHIPAGGAKVWNLGDVGQLPSPQKTPFEFSITFHDKLGTKYSRDTHAAVRRWGFLGKSFRADFE